MDKKLFGIRLGSFLLLIVCLLAAFVLWIYVNLSDDPSEPTEDSAFCEADSVYSLTL